MFEEVRGFPGDAIYKNSWRIGTETVETRGCSGKNSGNTLQFCRYGRCEDRVAAPAEPPDQLFCREGDALDLLAPTKQVNCSEERVVCRRVLMSQNLLCEGMTALQVMSRHPDWAGQPSSAPPPRPPTQYLLPGLNHYCLVVIGSKLPWLDVRKAVFRFVQVGRLNSLFGSTRTEN